MAERIVIIGGGLAGSEAAWQAANLGVDVDLYEMRPVRRTPVHHTEKLAELVCTNSLGSNQVTSASGLLKEEMRRLGSLIIAAADAHDVPAGAALAVDREQFAAAVSSALERHPRVRIHREEMTAIPEDGIVVIASGPLTSPALAEAIQAFTGEYDLYFYDAAAPIVTAESIDWDKGFWASRYGKGEGDDYFNCALTEDEYNRFYEALITAEVHEGHLQEELKYFEGCMPIEAIAERGKDTLRFGPMKPVGLKDPRTGKRPYAVVQLRKENRSGTLYNLVGFQTRMKWGEQKRVLRLIPALANAEIVRYGVMHRNTFINAPRVLLPTYQVRKDPRVFFAGQITGVEGYVESAGSGLLAGLNAARLARGEEPLVLPEDTMLGALAHYITSADPKHFQPMNSNFGLLPPLADPPRDKALRKQLMSERSLARLAELIQVNGLKPPVPAVAVAATE
ncbi:MAG: methylenetetrahydrofolate--tRNA-(uracil(54)-C(5))-methyltransferase (FADH(2)-oxidizing) TrmFO [Firmicutes bacterium ZCTH02-B6]|nr:MAG: methylenetetrahydrofolate--tRNA-(uracil(54)-C(5))-methyltransferase (FADH(2)-oxidizing) TrmFO [Firmicutes bacterium ZCTH02-B6]